MPGDRLGAVRSLVGWGIINAAQVLWRLGAWCIGGKAVFTDFAGEEDTTDRAPQPQPAAVVSKAGKAMVYDRDAEEQPAPPEPEPPLMGSARERIQAALRGARER